MARNSSGNYLFCERHRMPWEGTYNFLGGKLEKGEFARHCAAREFMEESGLKNISETDFKLIHRMSFFCNDGLQYTIDYGTMIWVYAIELSDLQVETLDFLPTPKGEDPIQWLDLSYYEAHPEKFAGEGYIGMLIKYYERVRLMGKKDEKPKATS